MKITDKSKVFRFSLFFMALYMISYITRINYGAVISEIVSAEGVLKSDASLALTAASITYGIGQLFSGFLGDKINPKKIIFIGLLLTISMNIAMPFCGSTHIMTIVWGINGLAQAFMWPPLVKIMTSVFTHEDYTKACMYVSYGSSLGTMFVYAISPLCILLSGWKSIFFLSAALAAVMAAAWVKLCPSPQIEKKQKNASIEYEKKKMPLSIIIFIAFTMLIIGLQGILRDGVQTWMPSYVSETFNLNNKIAILTGIVLPVFSILITKLTATLYARLVHNEMTLASVLFAIAAAVSLIMFLTNGISPVLSVSLSALLSGCTHGINWMMTSLMPPKFEHYGKISFMSGLLNFSTYVGSAISMYGIALFSEKAGWNATLCLWAGIAFIACVICFALKKTNKNIQ